MIAILSDIHSNLAALQAVLDDLPEVEAIWSLGDLVGYGPCPNEALDLIKDKLALSIAGNHDLGSIGQMDLNAFTADAGEACRFTNNTILLDNRHYLESLPMVEADKNSTLAHGSPKEPLWQYILSPETAAENFELFDTPLCFIGHTHLPVIYKKNKDKTITPREGQIIELDPNDKALINPGSVGQPRDGNPKSSYLLWDQNNRTLTFKRVAYDIKATQLTMEQANLPQALIDRLNYGL